MRSKFLNATEWVADFFQVIDCAGTNSNTHTPFTTGGVTIPGGSSISTTGFLWVDPVQTFLKDSGTPWNSVGNFPPCDIQTNSKTKDLKFTWALAGFKKEDVRITFEDDELILRISKETVREQNDWVYVKKGIKTSVDQDYHYFVPTEKFDISKVRGSWNDGLLEVVIPLRTERKPVVLEIK